MQKNIRNFCIIAHIDHGKSTLADRLLERTGAVAGREKIDQVLDQMDLERERGITIKLQAVRMDYQTADGGKYLLNLIDTPGHVDFSYEVSRSLAACEGALLVVDAVQGVEAQTLANVYLALEHDLEIIPVINKIDLPSADPERVKQEIEEIIGIDADRAILSSAKEGIGADDILNAIVERIPAPQGDPEAPLKALIFDSHFDPYRGVIGYIRVIDGAMFPDMQIEMMSNKHRFEISETGVFKPAMTVVDRLSAGEVGYFSSGIKDIRYARVGDTVTSAAKPAMIPYPGYKKIKPMVYSGLYPVETSEYPDLREALEKLQLNDAALLFEPETSLALGFGFRCGFLGLLHMEIIQERIEREYGLALVATAPSVAYRVTRTNGRTEEIDNPSKMPAPQEIELLEEPYIEATVMIPAEYVGAVMELCQERRGNMVKMNYPTPQRVVLTYELPLSEILMDFFDALKSGTRGYASLDYEIKGYREADLVKLDMMINGEPVDALSSIVHRDKALKYGRMLAERLRKILPRQLFDVRIQAAIGNKIIASETVKALRKDVLAKCYGGDISRKRKLLEKQKEGKKRMKQVGNVEIPQEAFLAVLKIGD